ncbi:MAG: 3'(2'),5'-bisphosphate nucleotidase CysQ [Candidatus Liberibacter ctenarytainae]|uniref:3'(2'),5'-bisphosphate nucleotidase CysQ n=1 Tax=Candidatus Liberibacter ctenarytainae TaxID=2020335 RepID=A0A937DLI2_9HYPH|nr:3'(2'),5'-bisphosphate nucleotidase CysQ [Candidatus Liberibacter ctenarytainae]
MYEWEKDLDIVREAVQGASAIAMRYFLQFPKDWWKKGGDSPVSSADIAVNDYLESFLRPLRPSYGWLSEENDDDLHRLNCETIFVVDPIDGTRAFIAGKKEWCISVAVVHRGRPVVGVIYASSVDKEFIVSIGMKSTCNGKQISVSSPASGDCLMVMASDALLKGLESDVLIEKNPCVSSLCLRLVMVAIGKIDVVLVQRNANDWDLAAADLLLECAGGALVNVNGQSLIYNRSQVNHDILFASSKAHFALFKQHLSTL